MASVAESRLAEPEPRPSAWSVVAGNASLSDRAFRLLVVLDALAGDRPFCRPSNGVLARLLGKAPRAAHLILDELEGMSPPWIRRVPDEDGFGRVGIVLLRRADTRLPVWPADRPLAEAATLLRESNPDD